jgi:putative transposase
MLVFQHPANRRLIRSPGGWSAEKSMRRLREHVKSDERILGDSDFGQSALSEQNEQLEVS